MDFIIDKYWRGGGGYKYLAINSLDFLDFFII